MASATNTSTTGTEQTSAVDFLNQLHSTNILAHQSRAQRIALRLQESWKCPVSDDAHLLLSVVEERFLSRYPKNIFIVIGFWTNLHCSEEGLFS